jgi:hypothetical protein
MAAMTPRCDACTYWRLAADLALSGDIWDADDKQGECRRHAPRPWSQPIVFEMLLRLSGIDPTKQQDHAYDDAEATASDPGITIWPGTTGADWCGEFRQREDRP